ncbi:ABC transporter ATP-binding protein [Saccharibacillus sp. CPCC 101409]|uniref:ABC transporter ATP-binding protein n=1 Tax=Saccharibacillus sp. CPCC 101409 TaxID=3058041 RepID=UPI0026740500|nr:ABC transporter ATP-binding protein [Saccharibacillus sp. CPCC 101409]MDO3408288.1 ABC transporter ATP-binding protein [Saccharibacillus sp. CPCC 101409]
MSAGNRIANTSVQTANGGSGRFSPWRILRFLLPRIASVQPKLFAGYVLLFVVDAAFFPLSVRAMQRLFDRIAASAQPPDAGTMLAGAAAALLMLFAIKTAGQLVNGVAYFIAETYDSYSTARLTELLSRKLGRLHPVSFEEPDTLSAIEKAYAGIRHAVAYVNTMLDVCIVYVPQLLFMGAYLFMLRPALTLSVLLAFAPVLLGQLIRARLYAGLEDRSSPARRKMDSYADSIAGRTALKQTRLLGGFPYFYRLYVEALRSLNTLKQKADTRANLLELGAQLLTFAGYFGVMALLAASLLQGSIGVGAFAAVFASIDRMFQLMEELIAGRLAKNAENFGKIRNYLRAMELPERGAETVSAAEDSTANTEPCPPAIVCENVSFTYPSAPHKSLDGIDLDIHPGETLAVVGANGSGKTTLVRLLTGLYLPTEGALLHNGVPTSELPPEELFAGTSAVFQHYRRYRMTLADNVTIGEWRLKSAGSSQSPGAEPPILCEKLESAAGEAGLPLTEDVFPDGFDTMLSREFGGVELSGGQWQRVAIARGLYRAHGFIVLDEPTAAIDPLEETRVYRRFAEAAAGRTALIVTHRLGSVRLADRILVLHGGRRAGLGTHEELLADCAVYREMWEAQAEYYTEKQTV